MSVPEEWVERAEYDIGTARDMLAAGRSLYVFFCCQQAIEKAIKAIIAQRTEEMPPRLHNLPKLATYAGLRVDDRQADLLRRLTNYYVQTRYPAELKALAERVGGASAEAALHETEELLEWLLSLVT